MLHQILEDSAKEGTENIISWDKNGASFQIFLPEVFNNSILPKYSKKQIKFRSFQRQLNIYGFKMPKKSCVYHHELFQRGDMISMNRMRPVPLKNRKSKEKTVEKMQLRQTNYRHIPRTLVIGSSSDQDTVTSGAPRLVMNVPDYDRGKRGPFISTHTSASTTSVWDYDPKDYSDNNSIDVVSLDAQSVFTSEHFDLFENMDDLEDLCQCKCNGSGHCFLKLSSSNWLSESIDFDR